MSVDVPSAPTASSYYAEFADKLYDEVAPTGPNDLALVRREPLGVIAAIVPWNYPLIISAWKLGPALLTGNSVVLKPAEQSPLSAIRLGELACEAGLPPGRFNVVPGLGEEAGQALARHPDVDMISFTGSTEVGRLMLRYAGESNLKRVALECGGKTPQVVFADADLAAAADGIAWGIYYNSGETCHAGSRADRARARQGRAARRPSPRRPPPSRSAIRSSPPRRWARSSIRATCSACSATSTAACARRCPRRARRQAGDGARAAASTSRRRCSMACGREMKVAREEIFGPVLAVMTFNDETQAVRAGQRHALRTGRRGVDRRHECRAPRVARRCAAAPCG